MCACQDLADADENNAACARDIKDTSMCYDNFWCLQLCHAKVDLEALACSRPAAAVCAVTLIMYQS